MKIRVGRLAEANMDCLLQFGCADGDGFVCQQCGLVRSKEEIRKIASELKSLSDKAPISTSSCGILLSLCHELLAFFWQSDVIFIIIFPDF